MFTKVRVSYYPTILELVSKLNFITKRSIQLGDSPCEKYEVLAKNIYKLSVGGFTEIAEYYWNYEPI